MKKIFIFIYIIVGGLVYSQSGIEVLYNTNFEGNKFKSELFHFQNNSLYLNYTKEIKLGTAHFDEKDELIGDMIDYKEEFFKDFKIDTVYSDSNIMYLSKKVLKEPLIFNWTIDYKTVKKILNYNCYPAKIYFKGRNYTAYFTNEIKVSDGPRKFCKLPGLILELKEDTGKLTILATSVMPFQNKVRSDLDIKNAKNLEYILKEAQKIYLSKKDTIEKKYNSHVYTDFSHNLEVYDLN